MRSKVANLVLYWHLMLLNRNWWFHWGSWDAKWPWNDLIVALTKARWSLKDQVTSLEIWGTWIRDNFPFIWARIALNPRWKTMDYLKPIQRIISARVTKRKHSTGNNKISKSWEITIQTFNGDILILADDGTSAPVPSRAATHRLKRSSYWGRPDSEASKLRKPRWGKARR